MQAKNSSNIYTLTANPSLDYSLFPDDMRLGEINRSRRELVTYGGKGINVSAMLKNLGVPSCALGFAGGFSGEELIRLAELGGVKCGFIKIKGETRINVKIISKEETAVNGAGPDISKEEKEAMLKKLASLSAGDTLIISGSIPKSLGKNFIGEAFTAAPGVRICADVEGEALKSAVANGAFLIKPNYDELCGLFGKKEMTESEIISSAKELNAAGVKNVLVSLGGRGAVLCSDGVAIKMRAPQGCVKSTVGAGDSMLAGFVAGLSKGAEYALSLAVAAGSATAFCEKIADGSAVMKILKTLI